MPEKLLKALFIIVIAFSLPLLIQAQTSTPRATPTPNVTECLCPMKISGIVKNAAGQPVAGAEVEVSTPNGTTLTDAAGYYFVNAIGVDDKTGCPAGDHFIYVRAKGYLQGTLFVGARCGNFTYNFTLAADPAYGLLGDVNGSTVVDILDALMTARYVVGVTDAGFNAALADVNADGTITIVDALIIAQYDVGLIDQLPPA